MQAPNECQSPIWMKRVLLAAGVYNLLWGLAVVAAPLALFQWADMESPRYPQIWQCVGMVVGVYGIGYCIAAANPFRHWPIVFVGLLGKVLGPIGFLYSVINGQLPWTWGATILTNDLIWWIPFSAILYASFRSNSDTAQRGLPVPFEKATRDIRSHRNASLLLLSTQSPTLVVFLRHSGCTFCREMLANLQRQRDDIERAGTQIAIVHMGSPMDGTLLSRKFDLETEHRFSDPDCVLYQAFDVTRGTFSQLFSWSVVKRGLLALSRGFGLGMLNGDGFRMPSAFVLVEGKVVAEFRASTPFDLPDFTGMARLGRRHWRRRDSALSQRNATSGAPPKNQVQHSR